jgi:short subunit dehydrogenase-like uncharacterized protein
MSSNRLLIYGANGYTGALIAHTAVRHGLRPILASRQAERVAPLAQALQLDYRAFALDDGEAIDAAFADVGVLLNCAGPFVRTFAPLVDACLRNGTHYLDITGEISVFESIAARSAEAKSAGILLLPGIGFDVVPSDCLAAHLKARLPSATRLTLAAVALGQPSRGTATTLVENLPRGGCVRRGGILRPVPAAWKFKEIDFGQGPVKAVSVPWGDVSTAFYSTGIPNIEFYMALLPSALRQLELSRALGWLLRTGPVQRYLKAQIQKQSPGPTEAERAQGQSLFWGQVEDDQGHQATARLRTPNGYTLTARTAVAAAEKALTGSAPAGFNTPSLAYGANFILEFEGVVRSDG